MAEPDKVPQRLYKYRGFSDRLLDMLVYDELYYSAPSDFNAPLDCRPTLDADISNSQLEQVLRRLHEQRVSAEMEAAAKFLKYRSPTTSEHIPRHSQQDAARLFNKISYLATTSTRPSAPRLQAWASDHAP